MIKFCYNDIRKRGLEKCVIDRRTDKIHKLRLPQQADKYESFTRQA